MFVLVTLSPILLFLTILYPQGSVLGPQWFTVYTSPVRDIILKYNLNYHVYADDTQLYITFKSSQEPADSCITTLEKCIQEIRSWMRQNFLKLNDQKTEFLLFGSRQQLSKVCLPFITIGDSQITPSSQARNLGVIFDSTMTLKPHISNIVRVSSFHIRNISRIRKYLNQSAAEQIIHAFVTSRLDNGNALLYGLPQNNISRLQHIQNTAARVVTLSRKSCHITPILKELHWLPVSQRIVFKLMLIVHKSFNNIAPIYISELLKVYTPSRNLRSSNMSLLKEPTSKRTWGDISFSVVAPRLWNHLPTKLKSCHSKTRLMSLLKTHLMSQVYL